MGKELERVTIVGNESEAELLCGLLRSIDIDCMYRITDLAFGQGGEMPLAGGGPREVLVRFEDLNRAIELVEDLGR